MKKNGKASKYYPIALELSKKLALVIGGGRVAERKVRALLTTGCRTRLISPTATPALKQMAKQGNIKWICRRARLRDLTGARIVIAATNDRSANEKMSSWARQLRIWINVVDKKDLSDFISPAVFHARSGTVTVYTDGKDPAFSRDLKNFLKEHWDDFLSYRNRS